MRWIGVLLVGVVLAGFGCAGLLSNGAMDSVWQNATVAKPMWLTLFAMGALIMCLGVASRPNRRFPARPMGHAGTQGPRLPRNRAPVQTVEYRDPAALDARRREAAAIARQTKMAPKSRPYRLMPVPAERR
jgi:hypothetical protein